MVPTAQLTKLNNTIIKRGIIWKRGLTHPASWRGFVVKLTSAATVDNDRPHIIVTLGNTPDKANSGSGCLAPSDTLLLQVGGSKNQAPSQSTVDTVRTCLSVTQGEAPSKQTLNTYNILFRRVFLEIFHIFYILFSFLFIFRTKILGIPMPRRGPSLHVSRERLALSQPNLPSCPPRVVDMKHQ